MSRLRVLVACLLMLVLPVQGFAAASLVFCAQEEPHHASVPATTAPAHHHHADDGDSAGSSSHHPVTDGHVPVAHQCGTCASCCHCIGIAEVWPHTGGLSTPASDPMEPLVRITDHHLPLPERPPRA